MLALVRACVNKYSQRVHVGIWYILRAKRGSYIPTLRPVLCSYMDHLGLAGADMGPSETRYLSL